MASLLIQCCNSDFGDLVPHHLHVGFLPSSLIPHGGKMAATTTAPHTCAHAHSTHTWAHEALCLTPAGVRGGRLQCRASAPRCPWTLRDSNAQGRTPEALARGCLMASRLAALLKAGGEELFGPEGQTERDHSGSLGAALGPWGLQHHGLLPRSPWPQPQDEVALT